jgi:hypothetical protein
MQMDVLGACSVQSLVTPCSSLVSWALQLRSHRNRLLGGSFPREGGGTSRGKLTPRSSLGTSALTTNPVDHQLRTVQCSYPSHLPQASTLLAWVPTGSAAHPRPPRKLCTEWIGPAVAAAAFVIKGCGALLFTCLLLTVLFGMQFDACVAR